MAYRINSFDVCASGMERLRNNDEFIIVGYCGPDTTIDDLCEQWLADVQICVRPDDFDYSACNAAIKDYADELRHNTFTRPNPFELEPVGEDDECCVALLYMEWMPDAPDTATEEGCRFERMHDGNDLGG